MNFVNRYLNTPDGIYLNHVAYTYRRTIDIPLFLRGEIEPELQVALLESYLTNLRAMCDFFCKPKLDSDISAEHFVENWNLTFPSQLIDLRDTINKQLSHLTKSRFTDSPIPIDVQVLDYFKPLQVFVDMSLKKFIENFRFSEFSQLFEDQCFPSNSPIIKKTLNGDVAAALLIEIREMYGRQVSRNQQFTAKAFSILGLQLSFLIFAASQAEFKLPFRNLAWIAIPTIFVYFLSMWQFFKVVVNYTSSRPSHGGLDVLLRKYLSQEYYSDFRRDALSDVSLNIADLYIAQKSESNPAPLYAETKQADDRAIRLNSGIVILLISIVGILVIIYVSR